MTHDGLTRIEGLPETTDEPRLICFRNTVFVAYQNYGLYVIRGNTAEPVDPIDGTYCLMNNALVRVQVLDP